MSHSIRVGLTALILVISILLAILGRTASRIPPTEDDASRWRAHAERVTSGAVLPTPATVRALTEVAIEAGESGRLFGELAVLTAGALALLSAILGYDLLRHGRHRTP
jgi:hypothetical protein